MHFLQWPQYPFRSFLTECIMVIVGNIQFTNSTARKYSLERLVIFPLLFLSSSLRSIQDFGAGSIFDGKDLAAFETLAFYLFFTSKWLIVVSFCRSAIFLRHAQLSLAAQSETDRESFERLQTLAKKRISGQPVADGSR